MTVGGCGYRVCHAPDMGTDKKIVVEPSAPVPLAALVEKRIVVRGMRMGMVLSGGNVDLDRLPLATG